jgi:hypothetical protein
MAKNQEGINGIIQKMAMVSDGLLDIIPNSKVVVVYSLNDVDFNMIKIQVNDFSNTTQLKIDISGTEFIFLKETQLNTSEDTP